ncbi:MAG: penicillin-binding protein activator LpoB [Desulfobacterales bacterium]|nr:penicillin-binding protein activator LpoB [Desulfobacterales bacterium]
MKGLRNVWQGFGRAFIVALLILFAAGCASTKVDRVEVDKTIDLSGRWNDTDSRLVSEEMVRDVLDRPWLRDHQVANQGAAPSVIVGTVRNRSDEHINTQTFVKDLERALVNSGEVDLVASSQERMEIRAERKDQASHSSEETAKEEGQEIGAGFMLQGSINTISDRLEGKEVKYYQVNLELIHIETHRKVWLGEKKIKKMVEKKKFWL